MIINKRYRDIFEQYIHKNEPTPLTVGTLVVCALCFLMLLIATFTKLTIVHPWFAFDSYGLEIVSKTINYGPQVPVMILIIYILRQNFSLLMFCSYLLTGFFAWPIFVLGGGLGYFKNYLFGYLLGFFVAIFVAEFVLKKGQSLKNRILMAVLCVVSLHICGFLYCIILALFKVIDVELVSLIVSATSGNKIVYDLLFSMAVIIVAPLIKNILWICMKPKPSKPLKMRNKQLEDMRKRNQIVSDDIDEHGENND